MRLFKVRYRYVVKLVDEVEDALVVTTALHADVGAHVEYLAVFRRPALHLKRADLDVLGFQTLQHLGHRLFRFGGEP